MSLTRKAITCLLLLLTPYAALAQDARPVEKFAVIASFSILGDIVRQIGGDRVDVQVLVGPGGDAHVYSPTPQDSAKLVAAGLIVTNGLKFEGWLDRLVSASGTRAPVLVASQKVPTIRLPGQKGHQHQDAHGQGKDRHGHDHRGEADPHAWQSVANVKIYVANIREALLAADPAGREAYESRAQAYLQRLDKLDSDLRTLLSALPRDRRTIVTSHDAFGYFAKAYGIRFVAPRGVSTHAEPSAKEVAALIRQIRQEKIRAVFLENITDPRVSAQIARETGAVLGGVLFSDSLSPPDGPAATYEAMMRHNAATLVKALGPQS
jgi:zinc/manganese transport system substrate-binding protein